MKINICNALMRNNKSVRIKTNNKKLPKIIIHIHNEKFPHVANWASLIQ